MKLRYLHLQDYPPIKDIKVLFASGSPLQRDCSIRFVVGVNGSGKSNLLRAIAEVFLALSEQRVPPFPVSLVYELGQKGSANHRTLLLHCPGKRTESSLWMHERFAFDDSNPIEVFDVSFGFLKSKDNPMPPGFSPLIAPGEWPSRATTPPLMALPNAVLAYTTGAIQPWQTLWNRSADSKDGEESFSTDEETLEVERPAGWNMSQELASQNQQSGQSETSNVEDWFPESSSSIMGFRRPILLNPALLKCALLAIALPQAYLDTHDRLAELEIKLAKAFRRERQLSPLQEMLQRGGWHYLVSVAFRCRLQTEAWRRNRLLGTAHDWLICAGEVIAEPHPTEARRTLYFDLKGDFSSYSETLSANDNLQISGTQGESLWALLGGHEATAFELFTKLVDLHQAGLFDDVELRLRRYTKPDESADRDAVENDVGVLRYEELSDGEQMVLGRMALFHLLEDQQDSLLLLDEPETHFNDLWKRDVVSVVDTALGKTSCEVVIATHAALVLTDALKDELVVLERTTDENSEILPHSVVRVLDRDIHTFGATGDHPLRDIFGAPDTVGRRASRILEVLIAAATLTDRIEPCWASENPALSNDIVDQLCSIVAVTEPSMTKTNVREALDSIEHFTVHFGAERPLTMKAVLEAFIRQTGPGYFQVELKRAWRRLWNEEGHVTQA
ncbi:MAG: AAA family ATPase [Gammaproteobacteria bacterium]|nr:AAA family ATPase [Gammaproteobacteria bacterium]